MESALCTLLSALVVLLCSSPECKGEDTVTQPEGDASVFKGHTATINCTFERSNFSNYYLFWYKQKDADSPKYMLRRDTFGTENNSPDFDKSRFDAEIKKNSVYLKIQDVRVSDSAVYYCALRHSDRKHQNSEQKPLQQRQHNTALAPLEGDTLCEASD